MIITDVIPLDKKRRKVYIDNQYAFPLYLSELRRFNIETGNEITGDSLEKIEEILYKRIRERILYLLDSSPRTEYEIRTKLFKSGYIEVYVTPVINRIKEYGYIDDYAYARMYSESLRNSKNNSRRVIEQKLYQKGISAEIISRIMDEVSIDETDLIFKVLKKKKVDTESYNNMDYASRRKVYGYLISKGFAPSNVSRCLGELTEEFA